MSIERRPEYQAAMIQRSADIDSEVREIEKRHWREYIADCIANRIVSPMIRPNFDNLEKGYTDDQIS